MKRLWMTTLFFAALAAGFSAQPAQAQIQVNISIGGFYDELEPYGRWVDCSYGDCWVPERVSRDWQPYSNGEWVYTEYGWTWVSYDPWGDDPYHYGTWVYTDRYGWVWIPGTVWAPAWVTWTYNDNYVGWAPLPPSIVFGSSGYSGRAIRMRPTQYVFVPTNRFVGTNVASVRIAPQRSATIFSQTTPVTRFGVSGGIVRNMAIPVETIQRATRTPIQTRSIRDAKTAPRPVTEWMRGDRRQVSIVAPARDVRQAIASRPQGGRRTGGFQGSTGGNERRHVNRQRPQGGRVYQPPAAVPTAPAQPARESYRGRPETSNAPGNRGRGRGHRPQGTGPQAVPQAAAPQEAPPPAVQANPADQRGRGRGRPQAGAPQQAPPPPAVEKNPGGQVREEHGRGKPEKGEKGGKGKKEKPEKPEKPEKQRSPESGAPRRRQPRI